MSRLLRATIAVQLAACVAIGFASTSFADDNSGGNADMHAALGNSLAAGASVPHGGNFDYTFASWDDGCSFGALPSVDIIQGPAHGSVQVAKGEHVVKNPLSICQGTPEQGTKLSYSPAPGYSGPDAVTYKVAWQDTAGGSILSNTYTLHLNVQ